MSDLKVQGTVHFIGQTKTDAAEGISPAVVLLRRDTDRFNNESTTELPFGDDEQVLF